MAFDPAAVARLPAPGTDGFEDARLRALAVWDLESGQSRSVSLAPFTDASWACDSVAFAPDGAALVGGNGGILRVVLPDDPSAAVSAETLHAAGRAGFALSRDGAEAPGLGRPEPGMGAGVFEELLLFDLATRTSKRITTHGQRLSHRGVRPLRPRHRDRGQRRRRPGRPGHRRGAAPAARRPRGAGDRGGRLPRRTLGRVRERRGLLPPLADARRHEAAAPHAAARGADGEARRAHEPAASSATRRRRPAGSSTSARSRAGRTCRRGERGEADASVGLRAGQLARNRRTLRSSWLSATRTAVAGTDTTATVSPRAEKNSSS